MDGPFFIEAVHSFVRFMAVSETLKKNDKKIQTILTLRIANQRSVKKWILV